MTETQRWRLWIGIAVGGAVLATGGMALALAMRSRTVVLLVLTLPPAFAIALLAATIRARRQDKLPVPPHLQGLEPAQRRLVAATADRAVRAADPDLRPAVIAHARHQRNMTALLLASGALTVGARVLYLTSDDGSGAVFDVVMIALWLLAAGFLGRYVLRFHRAMDANRPGPD